MNIERVERVAKSCEPHVVGFAELKLTPYG